MMCDHLLKIYDLPAGTPLQAKLVFVSEHLYAPMEVYYKRYFESVLTGSAIDTMVQLRDGESITASQYCIPDDGHVYRIVQAQHGYDADGLPITTLSLHRAEGNYDIAKPE